MERILACLAALCLLSGCVGYGPVERNAEYDLDVRNVSDQTVGVIVLRVRGGDRERMRVDLGPGGRFNQVFIQWEKSVAELRLTLEPDAPTVRGVVVDLAPGKTRLEVDVKEGLIAARAPKPLDSKGAPGP